VTDSKSNGSGDFLAIIIPAYKGRFLAEAIRSVLAQTDQRFRLYVFDDCSPENLAEIVHPLLAGTRHLYQRFAENLGGTALADQWSRCVRMTAEPWVWVFSDDDVMEPECVAEFSDTLEKSPPDTKVCRFNTLSIDQNGQVIRVNPPHPQFEPAIQFAYHRLRGERLSFAPEYLFARSSFDKAGGFLSFPAAWGSDDASWMLFAGEKPIVTVPKGRIHWRISEDNISGRKSMGPAKVDGALGYLEWLFRWSSEPHRQISGINNQVLRLESRRWFQSQLGELHRHLSLSEINTLSKRLSKLWGDHRIRAVAILVRFNLLRAETMLRRGLTGLMRSLLARFGSLQS
jgi:glycosyltransferase involved in cell wall biosynthesis